MNTNRGKTNFVVELCPLPSPHARVSKEPLERASFVTVSPHPWPYHSVCHMGSTVNLQLWTQSSKRSRELWVKSPPIPPLSHRILYSKAVKKRWIPWLPGNLNRVKNDVKIPGLPRVFLNGWWWWGGGVAAGVWNDWCITGKQESTMFVQSSIELVTAKGSNVKRRGSAFIHTYR